MDHLIARVQSLRDLSAMIQAQMESLHRDVQLLPAGRMIDTTSTMLCVKRARSMVGNLDDVLTELDASTTQMKEAA